MSNIQTIKLMSVVTLLTTIAMYVNSNSSIPTKENKGIDEIKEISIKVKPFPIKTVIHQDGTRTFVYEEIGSDSKENENSSSSQ